MLVFLRIPLSQNPVQFTFYAKDKMHTTTLLRYHFQVKQGKAGQIFCSELA